LLAAQDSLSPDLAGGWVWWRLPPPAPRNIQLEDILENASEQAPKMAPWRPPAATARLLDLMAPTHRERIRQLQESGQRRIGAVYRRTRIDEMGVKRQRAEVRFDGMAGCLRTPGGGSSRQTLLDVCGGSIRSRLLSPREAARLMGLPESYGLPQNATKAYGLCGDGLCVPVVRHLAEHLLQPLLRAAPADALAAAE
jgi:DNA (cytosine-5)-methyltransferase 1